LNASQGGDPCKRVLSEGQLPPAVYLIPLFLLWSHLPVPAHRSAELSDLPEHSGVCNATAIRCGGPGKPSKPGEDNMVAESTNA
jgi:hypothetical protein